MKYYIYIYIHICWVTPHKTAAIRPLISHLTNHPSKTSKTRVTRLEMQSRTQNRRFSMNAKNMDVSVSAKTYLHQLYSDTGCSLYNLPGALEYRDGWRERERERESQGNPCCQCDLMILMMFNTKIKTCHSAKSLEYLKILGLIFLGLYRVQERGQSHFKFLLVWRKRIYLSDNGRSIYQMSNYFFFQLGS